VHKGNAPDRQEASLGSGKSSGSAMASASGAIEGMISSGSESSELSNFVRAYDELGSLPTASDSQDVIAGCPHDIFVADLDDRIIAHLHPRAARRSVSDIRFPVASDNFANVRIKGPPAGIRIQWSLSTPLAAAETQNCHGSFPGKKRR